MGGDADVARARELGRGRGGTGQPLGLTATLVRGAEGSHSRSPPGPGGEKEEKKSPGSRKDACYLSSPRGETTLPVEREGDVRRVPASAVQLKQMRGPLLACALCLVPCALCLAVKGLSEVVKHSQRNGIVKPMG